MLETLIDPGQSTLEAQLDRAVASHYTVIALTRREQALHRVQERLFGSREKKGPDSGFPQKCAG